MIGKEYLLSQLRAVIKDARSFRKGEMYYNALICKGKILCLMELLHKIDPDYVLDKDTDLYLTDILNQDYTVALKESEGER